MGIITLQKKTESHVKKYLIDFKNKSIEYQEFLFITYANHYKQWFNCFITIDKNNSLDDVIKNYKNQGFKII